MTMLFVRAYDLPTMFGNKLAAFIGRVYQKRTTQTVPFEGCDVFDLVWFLQESQHLSWRLTLNWPPVLALLPVAASPEMHTVREQTLICGQLVLALQWNIR